MLVGTKVNHRLIIQRKGFAGVQGFEPRLKASKASVLPLDDTPKWF